MTFTVQVYRTQLQNVQVETNRLRYTIHQKDDDIRRVLQDLKDQRTANEGLARRLQSKEDEIDRLRKQLLDTPVAMTPTPLPPLPQNNEEVYKICTRMLVWSCSKCNLLNMLSLYCQQFALLSYVYLLHSKV